ncbi:MAG: GDSL family lipase [Nitrospirae bacterium]|nr:GDSL family lipase [Nitrospirota bacterium]
MGKRLLFIGDSLIEYFDWERRFPDHTVYNLGIAGETVEGLASRLKGIVRKVKPPDMVFIMSGINNMAMGSPDFINTYRDVVQEIRRAWPSAAIIVHSLLPVLFRFISNEDIRHMNVRLKHLAAGENILYLDIHAAFLNEKGRPVAALLEDDGVHVSEEGYRVWSAEMEKLL